MEQRISAKIASRGARQSIEIGVAICAQGRSVSDGAAEVADGRVAEVGERREEAEGPHGWTIYPLNSNDETRNSNFVIRISRRPSRHIEPPRRTR
jgi:hypothetical protein